MKLLIATDHTYLRYCNNIYDTYCFDRKFFDDYRKVFSQVEVICRMAEVKTLPDGALQSDGNGVRFSGIPNVHGIFWILSGGIKYRHHVDSVVRKADAVIARVPSELGWIAVNSARRAGKPCMTEIIGNPLEGLKAVGKGIHYHVIAHLQAFRLKKMVKKATAVSYVSRLDLPSLYPVISGTPYDYISSIRLDAKEISNPKVYIEAPKKIKIVFVASLLPYKRHKDLIYAFSQLAKYGIEGELHFAGNGILYEELHNLCKKLSIIDKVVFHGHISDKHKLISLLDSSDLFIIPSATEGLPRVVIEAMARGLPVIGSNVGGIPELVRNNDLFKVGDTNGLTELILRVIKYPECLNEMSLYSIETAIQYSNEVLSPRRIRLYKILREKSEILESSQNIKL
jgi:glycosyltransferase involved in cell wall biosynthesis